MPVRPIRELFCERRIKAGLTRLAAPCRDRDEAIPAVEISFTESSEMLFSNVFSSVFFFSVFVAASVLTSVGQIPN